MTKRIVTKIGDVFCAEIDNRIKRYFQYIVNDMEQLNSSVIRVLKLIIQWNINQFVMKL